MGFCENSTSEQFQNSRFEPVDMNRSPACDFRISEAVNKRLKQISAESGEKGNYLSEILLNLGPIGLTFSNTDSFVDSVEKKSIFHAKNSTKSTVSGTNRKPVHGAVQAKLIYDAEKCKASNFGASLIRIGSWKEVSKREGALVAKCYYAKKKLVWEIMKESLKSKIEIQWSDILSIRASTVANEPGILEIELNTPPAFYQETDPMPRKHTLWKVSGDFTNGQALINRRHYLEFPPGALDKHYEKLLQCDSRLFMLSQKTPFPTLPRSPYFPSVYYNNGITETSLDLSTGQYGSNISGSGLQLPFSIFPGPMQHVQAHDQINQPYLSIEDSTAMGFSSPLHEVVSNRLGDNNPPMANMWSTTQGMIDYAEVLGTDDQIQQPFSSGVEIHVGEQIQEPFYFALASSSQVNPATSFQNYDIVSSAAPCGDDDGAGTPILDPQVHNNTMNQWIMSDQGLPNIDQITWVRSSLGDFTDSPNEENGNNDSVLGASSWWSG